jgi:hypothetical protein
MFNRNLIMALAVLAACAPTGFATAKDTAKPSYPALYTDTNIVGETIRYPKGPAHITAAIVTLTPGGRTIVRKHGVPLLASIPSCVLTADYASHGTRTLPAGTSASHESRAFRHQQGHVGRCASWRSVYGRGWRQGCHSGQTSACANSRALLAAGGRGRKLESAAARVVVIASMSQYTRQFPPPPAAAARNSFSDAGQRWRE